MYRAFLTVLLAAAVAEGRQFENPIIRGVYAAYAGATYYKGLYYIVFSNDSIALGERFPIYQSKDLQNWGFAGYVFPNLESQPKWAMKQYFYSAEIHVVGEDNFRVYFSASSRYRIGVAFATNILGPYQATSQPLIEDPSMSVSDPNLLNENGILRLYWRLWNGTIQGRDLTSDGLSVTNGPVYNVITQTLSWENSVASPSVFKRNNWYYIIYSTAWYGIGVARSSTPFGPYTKNSERILIPAGGRTPSNGAVVQDIDGVSQVLIYDDHFYPKNSTQQSKELVARSLLYNADGWPYVT